MESSHNFCSSVNGDGDNDVTEVYENDDDDEAYEEDVDHNRVGDSDDQDDVGLEDEEEVDSEVDNDNYRDYDDFWIPGFFKEECITIDTIVDIRQLDMEKITVEDVSKLDFCDLEIAYLFYCWYAKITGFSVRKSHILRNTCRETLQQTFVCLCAAPRKKKESKCGCEAMFCVHVYFCRERWYVTCWNFEYNHLLLDLKLSCLLPAHKKMSATDIIQIENYRKVGFRPPHMYVAFANHCGGYDKVGFIRKDIYNQEVRMRKQHTSDASGALKYLHDLRKKDPMMYVSYSADEGSRLQRLFCCDAESQLLYEVFGDVLAFDATYKKNKYLCPFVVFSSVNHHNQTIVFGAAIVTDETKETYVWLLEQFLEAMKGKTPYKQVLKWLKKLMLGDFEVIKFEEKWKEMVATFELEDNSWIVELHEKRMKWSPAHLRGNFFAGIRATSQCEAFHAHVAKYSADHLLTKEMFILFQSYVSRTIKLGVVDCKEMVMFSVYIVVKYCSGSVWRVSYCPSTVHFSCCCMRMQM
ncbi:hypothetical protein AAZX31_14G118500 [Glycine max]